MPDQGDFIKASDGIAPGALAPLPPLVVCWGKRRRGGGGMAEADGAEMVLADLPGERLAQAFGRFGDELVRALTSLLGDLDDARDVAQEAFLKCWRSRDRLGDVRDLKAWLFRVGLNAARDLRRNAWHKRSRPLLGADRLCDDRAAPTQAVLFQETLQRLHDALAELRPEEREVFHLRHQGNLSYEQIALRQGATLGTVKTRMRAALARLRKVLEPGLRG
jgi:RNA polymerase sigma-70 factor (ECF subfamily)